MRFSGLLGGQDSDFGHRHVPTLRRIGVSLLEANEPISLSFAKWGKASVCVSGIKWYS